MAGYMLEGFGACFEIPDLFSVSHGVICTFRVPVTEQRDTCLSTGFVLEVRHTVFPCDSTPVTDTVCSVIRSEVVRDTRLTPYEPWRFATGTLIDRMSFEIRGVLHHARRYRADVRTRPQLLLLSLGEGESLCAHILCIN